MSIDPATYRDPAEVARAREADPLLRARAQLLALGVEAAAVDALDTRARAEIAAAQAAAEAAPWPQEHEAYEDVTTIGAGVWQ